jgi:hypothetical protein
MQTYGIGKCPSHPIQGTTRGFRFVPVLGDAERDDLDVLSEDERRRVIIEHRDDSLVLMAESLSDLWITRVDRWVELADPVSMDVVIAFLNEFVV